LPLRDELEIVFSNAPHAVVMIDDFAVSSDSGYEYDDYGDGKALVPSYLRETHSRFGLLGYYPSVASSEECGAKRGSIVLCTRPSTAQLLKQLPALRAISSIDELIKTNDSK
jgi:hypothetical protein